MKRYLATALWFYSFWYAGSMLAALIGVSDLLGPVLGIAAAAVVGLDPRHVIWSHTARPAQAPGVPAAA